MISLSKIIKSTRYAHSKEAIILSVKAPPLPKTVQPSEKLQVIFPEVESAKNEAEAILLDAENTANRMLEDAAAQAEQLKQQALAEIAEWWEQKRQEAEQLFRETEAEARQAGFAQGVEEGKAFVIREEQQTIQTARDVLESAYRAKEQIIAEAEPFVVELSMEVAKKVIGQELSGAPEKILELARRVLRRSRVQGQITLCVNHRYFDFMEEHRHQLLALLDGQAELSIVPDYTVQDEGCVIRTPLGSVDARIDTQLQEIKQVLLEIAQGSETDERS
jgi:flagellar assembly protein FliH